MIDTYCFIINYHNGKFLVSLLCSFNCGVSDPPECSNTSTDVETNADDDVLEPILAYKHLSRLKLFITIGEVVIKGGSKVWVLGQGGACNSAPNGPNDLQFCMQGAFVGYF